MMRGAAASFALAASLGSLQPAVAAPNSPSLPWSAPATTEVVTEDRKFTSGDAELTGTLHLPGSGQPVAAIVVTHRASSPLLPAALHDPPQPPLPRLGPSRLPIALPGPSPAGQPHPGGALPTP